MLHSMSSAQEIRVPDPHSGVLDCSCPGVGDGMTESAVTMSSSLPGSSFAFAPEDNLISMEAEASLPRQVEETRYEFRVRNTFLEVREFLPQGPRSGERGEEEKLLGWELEPRPASA